MLEYKGSGTLLEPYIGSIGSKSKRYKETPTRLDGHSHIMRNTGTSTLPKERITTDSYPIGA